MPADLASLLFAVSALLANDALPLQPAATPAAAECLARVGLSPATLASCGVTAGELVVVLDAVAPLLADAGLALDAADDQAGAARAQADALRRTLISGLSSDADRVALQAAADSLAAAEAQRATVVLGLRATVLELLPSDAGARIGEVLSTEDAWAAVPAAYRTQPRPEAELARWRDALAEERRSARRGIEVPEWAATALAAARSDVGVATALASGESAIGSIQGTLGGNP